MSKDKQAKEVAPPKLGREWRKIIERASAVVTGTFDPVTLGGVAGVSEESVKVAADVIQRHWDEMVVLVAVGYYVATGFPVPAEWWAIRQNFDSPREGGKDEG